MECCPIQESFHKANQIFNFTWLNFVLHQTSRGLLRALNETISLAQCLTLMNTNRKPNKNLQWARSLQTQTSWHLSVHQSVSSAGLVRKEGHPIPPSASSAQCCTLHAQNLLIKVWWVNPGRDGYFIIKADEFRCLTTGIGQPQWSGLRTVTESYQGVKLDTEVHKLHSDKQQRNALFFLMLISNFPCKSLEWGQAITLFFPPRPNKLEF